MWKQYLTQLGYTGSVANMLREYYVDYAVPQQFRNYIYAGLGLNNPQNLFVDGSKGYIYDNNDYVNPASWRRNLLTYSEQFDNAAWSTVRASVTANATMAPDGATTADKVVEDTTAGNTHLFNRLLGNPLGAGTYTYTAYLKQAGRRYSQITLIIDPASTNIRYAVMFDLQDGVVTTTASVVSPTATAHSITSIGDGWYRCSITIGNPSGLRIDKQLSLSNTAAANASGVNYDGDGTSGVFIWGAQLELGSTPTTYQRITDFNSDFLAAYPNTTLFVDSAGTQPATVNGLVGLQLDKSASLALGAELLTNGDFSSGSTAWSVSGTDATHIATFSGGTLRYQSDTTSPVLTIGQSVFTVGKWYEVTTVCSAHTSGAVRTVGHDNATIADGVGTKVVRVLATQATFSILRVGTNVDLTIDSVSIKELPGNHRYQTTTGSKPILRGTPVGGNIVTNGDFADGTGWTTGANISITGGKSVWTATTNSILLQNGGMVAGKVYRIRYQITAYTSGNVRFGLVGGTAVLGAPRSTVGTHEEYLVNTNNTNFYLVANFSNGFVGEVDNIEVHDVSADAVTAPYGLQYDGVDDFLTTAPVDFTATDKMAVVMGVRKLSDVGLGILVENGTGGENGSFRIGAPATAGAGSYNFNVKGTVISSAGSSGVAYPAPNTSVVCGTADISGDSVVLRVNSAQINASAGDLGTGNLGNLPIYFGRRGGTSFPMNGLDFGGICVNKTLTASQLSSAERWVNQRTGAY
jgi:hypothetical protein